jgi:hypothetical protein
MESLRKFVGKSVKDPYGKDLGKLVGVTSSIKGEINNVSIELYNGDFVNFPSRQLSVNGMVVSLAQDWAIEAEELVKELDLLRRRDNALNELSISGDVEDTMYKQLKEQFRQARDDLLKRSEAAVEKLAETSQKLDEQIKVIQAIMANNKMHYTSGELGEEAYNLANESVQNGLRHFSSEKKSMEDKINSLIASRDSAEDIGTSRIEPQTKPTPVAEPSVLTKAPGLTKTGGPRDIVIVRMEP